MTKQSKQSAMCLKGFFLMMYKVDPALMIIYSKIILSNGFWQMVAEVGQQFNFAYAQVSSALPLSLVAFWHTISWTATLNYHHTLLSTGSFQLHCQAKFHYHSLPSSSSCSEYISMTTSVPWW
jgi:hypothetical protein